MLHSRAEFSRNYLAEFETFENLVTDSVTGARGPILTVHFLRVELLQSIVERSPNKIQLPLVLVGYLVTVFYGRQLHTLAPPIESVPPEAVSAELYNWSTVLFGVALIVFGLSLSNRSILHRIRVLRLSNLQRRFAMGCALLLVSPWLTAIFAGIALDFQNPFTTLWFIAFIGGFAGLAGLLLGGILRVVQVYGKSSNRFPYVGVDMSRRKAIRGGIFTLIGGGAVATTFAAGRVNLGESWPEYHGRAPVVYERDELRVQAVRDPVRLGQSISFEITNLSPTERVNLGCHIVWALHAYEDGSWHHVMWTAGRYYQACATSLEAGATTTETVPLSEAEIGSQMVLSKPSRPITPGTYRFVLLGSEPYLAVNFQILPR